ncbi:hypothetical protein SKAU_G00217750 [Synaphobranchus kaupii]|uniref:Uncharacterized protein n=1 Tax=Synaphobranchus kaupii TaxID=118154 RepID=A0A9Q1FAP2_SYNKA|nr:hypothetical protein SKAU_G00217750 [Synaphobranchus kaupii]
MKEQKISALLKDIRANAKPVLEVKKLHWRCSVRREEHQGLTRQHREAGRRRDICSVRGWTHATCCRAAPQFCGARDHLCSLPKRETSGTTDPQQHLRLGPRSPQADSTPG